MQSCLQVEGFLLIETTQNSLLSTFLLSGNSPLDQMPHRQEARLKELPSVIHSYESLLGHQSLHRNNPIISSIMSCCGKEASFKNHCSLTATRLLGWYQKRSLRKKIQSTENRHPKSSTRTLQAPHIFLQETFQTFLGGGGGRKEELGFELRVLCMSGKHSTTELQAQPFPWSNFKVEYKVEEMVVLLPDSSKCSSLDRVLDKISINASLNWSKCT